MLSKRLAKDAIWALAGQSLSAAGVLVGVRLLTTLVDPKVYGATALYLGIAALAVGILVAPLMQGLLRFYPNWSSNRLETFRLTIISALSRSLLIGLATTALFGVILVEQYGLAPLAITLCGGLIVLDGVRSLETTFMNASGNNRAFAIVAICEAWARPLAAVICVRMLGPSASAVLLGYAAATGCILAFYYGLITPKRAGHARQHVTRDEQLLLELKRFSLPIAPTSLLGWLNGVADRYLIAALLGLEQAGIYAAIYGLISRPFLMLGGAIELTFRPPYYQLTSHGNSIAAARLLCNWLAVLTGLVTATFLGIWIFDARLITILLSHRYQSGISLVPWISGGYALIVISDVFTKACYARGDTGRIMIVQIVGGILGVLLPLLGILWAGLIGAAVAVPAYFGCVLLMTVFVARRLIRVK